ncbi:uncharacterized protein LOC113799089 [Dermatophagoides pteronyssinus]|uniref:Uncharacterized protein LOC113799089 n=1 Tax=Dermatophagoides pteronyssinus TaxID=6956 RepID=A0A6P6YIX8_DERPT|nr:uncharacterized protein LOC113799089 [Dermatophagoides pteronyssinus]
MCFKVIRRDELWCFASIIALFCPPLAVMMMTGCGIDFLLNCCLTFLLWIPGFIHAYCIIYCPEHIDPNAKLQMTEAAIRWRARKQAERQAADDQARGIERL